jgi:hypothetical protein
MNIPNLVNSAPIEITMANGGMGVVQMRRLSIRQLYSFVEFITTDKTPELVAMCCAQELEWIDTLSDESFAMLAKKAIEANFQRAVNLAKEDQTTAVKIFPVLQRLGQAYAGLKEFQTSLGGMLKDSLLAVVPSVSAEATGSASSTSP